MKNKDKAKEQLVRELAALRQRISSMEASVEGHTEEALRDSMEMYRILVEHSLQGIVIIQDTHIVFANAAFTKISGYTMDELLSLSPDEVRAMIHPDDQALVWGRFQDRLKGKPVPPRYEYRGIKKDGTLRWLEMAVNRIEFRGKYAIQGAIVNVSDRKRAEDALLESEERYRSLFDRLSVGVFQSTPDGRFLNANPAFTRLLGCPDLETLLNTPVITFYMNPEDREQWKKFTEEKGESFSMELQWQKLDGSPLWVRENARIVKDGQGRVQYYEGVAEDITDRNSEDEKQKNLEMQLQHAQRMEAIGTLAGGIAHDFNNILSAIIGYTEIALFHEPSEVSPTRQSLEQVLVAGERAKDLVKQILTFSRQAEEDRRPVLLEPLVEETLKLLKATLPSNVEIRKSIEHHAGCVMADPTQVHQILMNLCTNAYHAMRGKGGVLKVNIEDVELGPDYTAKHLDIHPGPYIKLIISDTGHGIEENHIDHIFEPYFTTKEKTEGTGMGLAVVHGIIKDLSGSITVSSEPEKGTTFNVFLPRIEVVEVEAKPEEITPLPMGNEQILFVDDEPSLTDLGKQMLECLGYKVEVRTSPVEALEAFRTLPNKFDLVITDMTMPKMTGDELVKELMAIRSDIPIILCTGFSERITEEKAKAIGISAFAMKPFVIRDLANTIYKVLDQEKEK